MKQGYKKVCLIVLICIVTCSLVPLPAIAQSGGIEGRWSKGSEGCQEKKNYNGEFIVVTRQGFEFDVESGCQFSGGDTSNSDHWVMRGTCEYAGQYEGGGTAPVSQIELISRFDVLKISIRGDKEFEGETSYVVKCD